MGDRLKGKVAIVTASTQGIGLAIAKRLARDGASVVICSRKKENVDRTVKEITSEGGKAFGLVCHVAKKEDRARLISMTRTFYGRLDILVSNAAANPIAGPILDMTEEAWDKILDVNVKSAFFLCKEAIPLMQSHGGGSIVFVSSIAGYTPRELAGFYGLSKTALFGLTKAMVPQCAGMNIRVNTIAPGLIKTNFSKAVWSDESVMQDFPNQVPLGRMGTPEECAGAVSFLVSDDASYITGETIVIAGGKTSRL